MTNVEKQIKELNDKISSLQELVANRGLFIDWVNEHHPDVVKEYLGFNKE